MLNFIFPILFIICSVFFLALSKNAKNNRKLSEDNGEHFALQANKVLRLCGYSLLTCSLLWLVVLFI